MAPPGRAATPAPRRLLRIGLAALAMALVVFVLLPRLRTWGEPGHPAAAPSTVPHPPIASEAGVFRLSPGELAVDLAVAPRAQAHPRSQSIFRSLRAYPGAPPRIPHGLTQDEFRATQCNSCHQRGGFVPRFGTYAPVTPHPEWSQCLQCHAPDAMTVGLGIPAITTDVMCGQCHVDPDEPPPTLVALDWVPMDWPGMGPRAMDGSPPAIPHDLELRGNCLACHGGPSALQGIRTTHPERTDCRSCHVPAFPGMAPAPGAPGEAFTRPLDGAATGGARGEGTATPGGGPR
jgi:nitrate reductase (cytochrome), electron transfer subunit